MASGNQASGAGTNINLVVYIVGAMQGRAVPGVSDRLGEDANAEGADVVFCDLYVEDAAGSLENTWSQWRCTFCHRRAHLCCALCDAFWCVLHTWRHVRLFRSVYHFCAESDLDSESGAG